MISLVEGNEIYQRTRALALGHAKLNSLVRTTNRELEGSAVTNKEHNSRNRTPGAMPRLHVVTERADQVISSPQLFWYGPFATGYVKILFKINISHMSVGITRFGWL